MPASDDAMRLLFTAQRGSRSLAGEELLKALPSATRETWLSPEVGVLRWPRSWRDAVRALQIAPPLWTRHVCPGEVILPLARHPQDVEALVEAAGPLAEGLDRARPFSVQTRLLGDGDWPYGRFELNEALSQDWVARGGRLDVRNPAQVLSLNVTPEQAYVGLSWAADNLSNWAGGEQRFRRERGQISRAEFKLLEALAVFRIVLPSGGQALDLGAAPGGWTRVALHRGMRVVAVDPADLHPSLGQHPQVRHAPIVAQRFLTEDKRRFDLLLNDMRMDARGSCQVMLRAYDHLAEGGTAIMTVKLPQRQQARIAQRALSDLTRRYALIGARQLFHNRSEITVALMRL